jgi:hypothetical protein
MSQSTFQSRAVHHVVERHEAEVAIGAGGIVPSVSIKEPNEMKTCD